MIIFLHFHKAAGMSMIKFFRKHGYQFHQPNNNGNPWTKHKKKPIYFWQFTSQKLLNWTHFLEHSNKSSPTKQIHSSTQKACNILVCEWNFLPPLTFHQLPQFTYITCLRDPWSRYISNYLYEPDQHFTTNVNLLKNRNRYHRHNQPITNFQPIQDFHQLNILRNKRGLKLKLNYNKFNYYIRMLNGLGQEWSTKLTETHLEQAKQVLQKFDIIIILELPESFQQLRQLAPNTHPTLPRTHRSIYKKPPISPKVIRQFKKTNYYDYQLYEFAQQLVREKLSQINKEKLTTN